MQQEFYSNGKLLLSGEYAILDGAIGLAIPTKYGQSLVIEPRQDAIISWKSIDTNGHIWFTTEFNMPNLSLIKCSNNKIKDTLLLILLEAKKLNSKFLDSSFGYNVETKLTFPKNWGLGTSSTLINSIAQWAKVDAHKLLWNSFGGSGYDISCAQHHTPILYQIKNGLPKVELIDFKPSFKDAIFFVYLNQKQNSKKAIANYRNKKINYQNLISKINNITLEMVATTNLFHFKALITEHEELLSVILDMPQIKQKEFSDYSGAIKSLGAWGGDFIMAVGDKKTPEYFKSKGFDIIIPFTEMILN